MTTKEIEQWKNKRKEILISKSSVIDTNAGPVEYGAVGEGPPFVLIFQGAMSSYYEGLVMGRILAHENGLKVISPSRPGYLRTPLETGKTPEAQADAFAALLDELKVEKVVALAVSGGGPSSLYFALKYPHRTEALILVSAVRESTVFEDLNVFHRAMLNNAFSDRAGYKNYTFLEERPEKAIKKFFPDSAPAILKDPEAVAFTVRVMKSTFPLSLGKVGSFNDFSAHSFFPIDKLKEITVPALVLHSKNDEMAPYSGILPVSEKIPGAQLKVFETGGHLFFIPHWEVFKEEIAGFIEEHTP